MDHASTAPTVLELRIHGVANTPPHGTLDLPAAEVVQSDGDALGSFWTLTPEAAARDRALPPGDVHALRPDVRREAYSWGAMARLGGLPLGGAVGAVVRIGIRVLWAAIVPFGLANVAYWARRVPPPDAGAHPARPASPHAGPGRRGAVLPEATAALTRLFALALTLLLAAAASTVVLSTVGTECMRAGGPDVVLVCDQVPDALYGLARMDHGDRLGVLSLVPVVLVLALVLVARSGQVRFDDKYSAVRAGRTSGVTWGAPLLRAGFWTVRAAGGSVLWAHLGATLGLTAVLLTWIDGRSATGTAVAWTGAGVIAAAAALVSLRTDDDGVEVVPPPWKPVASVVVFVAGAGTWAMAWAVSARAATPDVVRLVGIEVVPALLGAVLVGIGASALVWRSAGRLATLWGAVPAVAVACVAALTLEPSLSASTRTVLVLVAVSALVVPTLAAAVTAVAGRRPAEGWAGAGPGVLLLSSAATAAVYSSLAVLGTQWWLRGGVADGTGEAGDVAGGGLYVPVPRDLPDRPDLYVPPVFTEFGAATVVVLGLFVVLALIAVAPAVVDLARGRRLIPVAPRTEVAESGPASLVQPDLDGLVADAAAGGDAPAGQRILRARLAAALAHRAEVGVGALAVAAWLALTLTIPLRTPDDPTTGVADAPALLVDLAVPALGVVAVALLASALVGATESHARPWGLLWDLMCFLPRSAHPFGPPSYAGRAVPEVRSRVDSWLTATDLPSGPAREAAAVSRRVVLSAHSMGGVLAAAVVLIRAGNPVTAPAGTTQDGTTPDGTAVPVRDPRVGLLTYGVQLRPYFGRFFPELLGPSVLGTPACTGPAWTGDPWGAQVEAPEPPPTPGRGTLLGLLTPGPGEFPAGTAAAPARPAWVNLWRRTDFLGFPAHGYGENAVDRGAEEVDRGAYLFEIAAHTGYPRSWAYHRAFDDVARVIGVPDPAQDADRPGDGVLGRAGTRG
ncbi:hypothetical protein L1785_10685 [Antribacter sp. KLBMP9083]|uniref:Uncharacterized protein n=1 Tax=Antribacter soli TaxID=2910976 RepID=A0AA41QE27_9MICO|nr:hypothetical protein [Antribacter soli]MCF4121447.1 hypothetical protein [Antribacter soli]